MVWLYNLSHLSRTSNQGQGSLSEEHFNAKLFRAFDSRFAL